MRRIKNPLGSGVHLHIGRDIGKVPTSIDSVKAWANKILKEDNDMLYLRRKNGVLTWVKANGRSESKWEQLDENDVPTVIGVDGVVLAPPVVEETAEESEFRKLLADLPSGWYQDTSAELHHYLGNGDWDNVTSNTLKKKMNKELVLGKFDYLG